MLAKKRKQITEKMYIVISQYLTWQKKQFQQTAGVLKMHKHLEPADP